MSAGAVRDDIDKLNDKVQQIMADIASGQLGDKNPMKGNPEAVELVKNGAIVYHRRSMALFYGLLAFLVYSLVVTTPSMLYTTICIGIMLFYVDWYGAVIHVILDNPKFCNYPILGPPCLEFQWHHAIPQDIVSKSFVEVCGDLNVTLMLHFALLFVRNGFDNGPLNCMMAAKAVCAFLGQWSHRMAHTQLQHRPAWVKTAQNMGLLVSPELHKTHHTVYDDGFPILNGWSAPLAAWLNRVMPDRHMWLAMFMIVSVVDVWALTYCTNAVFLALNL